MTGAAQIENHRRMAEKTEAVVAVETAASKLPDGVIDINALPSEFVSGCRVFVHYNGPTDQLTGMCTGMAVLDPGATPHPPHQHPEEEFLIVSEGTGEIECAGKITQVGPGQLQAPLVIRGGCATLITLCG